VTKERYFDATGPMPDKRGALKDYLRSQSATAPPLPTPRSWRIPRQRSPVDTLKFRSHKARKCGAVSSGLLLQNPVKGIGSIAIEHIGCRARNQRQQQFRCIRIGRTSIRGRACLV
jgi:hypothetical protein